MFVSSTVFQIIALGALFTRVVGYPRPSAAVFPKELFLLLLSFYPFDPLHLILRRPAALCRRVS